MDGIDISSYQAGIDLSAVPCDFAIVKASEGTGYVNPDFARAADQTMDAGRLLGVYHYINGYGAAAEMDHFARTIEPYIGRCLICLDWESGGNRAWGDVGYLERCIDAIVERTGRYPVVYASAAAFPWSLVARKGCGTWVAQYASNDATGYQDRPWNEGAYECNIRQYSSHGRLAGWGGNLDINKCYAGADWWRAVGKYDEEAEVAEEEEDMLDWIIIQPYGEERLVWHVGGKIYALTNEDQPRAIDQVYQAITGRDQCPRKVMGEEGAPWYYRFLQSCGGEEIPCPDDVWSA